MMLNEVGSPFRHDAKDASGNPINANNDIYTFEGEDRVDIGDIDNIARGDGLDNAWQFEADTDGDGINDAYVVYSILLNTPDNDPANDALKDLSETALQERAAKLEVRHGPQSLISSSAQCPAAQQVGIEDGWFSDEVSTAFLRKNFQVDAIVIPGVVDASGTLTGPDPSATVVTLEFHQDRTFDRGNKWGAWFRNDIEAFPGPPFRWNGAMHSEGSVIIGRASFESYLISSEYSCFNVPGASEISVGNTGQIVFGRVDSEAAPNNGSPIHIYRDYGIAPDLAQKLAVDTDSVEIGGGNAAAISSNLSGELLLDPVKLLTADISELRTDDAVDVTTLTPDDWKLAQPELSKRIILGEREPLSDNIDDTYRDGHWEELAADAGTRIIVGQRLELGEPLAPWEDTSCAVNGTNLVTSPSSPGWNRCHEARQRVTLADKLAAVQATAVYGVGATEPMACLATTVHPGTAETLKRSATFHDFNKDLGDVLVDGGTPILALEDFFTGRGTNGWEFEPPSAASSGIMETALKNLAHFAGDPKAGAPFSADAVQDGVVHPYPSMAMWGDFSLLRYALKSTTTPTTATRSYEATASCLLGMLAHNMTYLNKLRDYLPLATGATDIPKLVGDRLKNIENGDASVPADVMAIADVSKPESLVAALEEWREESSGTIVTNAMVNTARMITTMAQVERDREYGYDSGGKSACEANFSAIGLDLQALCSDISKYPVLFSIFPKANHLEIVLGDADQNRVRGFDVTASDPTMDPAGYFLASDVNGSFQYQELTDAQIEQIALKPREMADWTLPHAAATGVPASAPNSQTDVLIKCENVTCDGGGDVQVAFKDAAIMDGRQLMNVRILDLNMERFKTTMLPDGEPAIIYAFREDAVREDSIVRPHDTGADAATCTTNHAAVLNAVCLMNAGQDDPTAATPTFVSAFDSIDPPLAASGDSIKPVDYFPDPDRRPYGFRLRNGRELNRSTAADVDESISFVSDNPVYVMGDFNLHQNDAGTKLEEFKGDDLLDADYGDFYGRGADIDNVDQDFGRSNTDLWRPTEVVSDGATILSNQFCDGSIRDVFDIHDPGLSDLDTKYGCDSNSFTSYANFPYPNQTNIALGPNTEWALENPSDADSPVEVSHHGNPVITDTMAATNADYRRSYRAHT
ncbi:MAG: hypothetical protein F6K09_07910, partial [Merismopedia sp. SIO2A8]|nr:hypothetical protein [Merismopedia sp. SIO2A8]